MLLCCLERATSCALGIKDASEGQDIDLVHGGTHVAAEVNKVRTETHVGLK